MFIRKIKVNKVRHLKDLEINLGEKKQHLILTGKNGSGKTTLLASIYRCLESILPGQFLQEQQEKNNLESYQNALSTLPQENRSNYQESLYQNNLKDAIRCEENLKNLKKFKELHIELADISKIVAMINSESFVIKLFGATNRNTKMKVPKGVEKVDLRQVKSNGQVWFLNYMVHLQTQLAYASLSNNETKITRITGWFCRFKDLLKQLFENENIALKYDEESYNFVLIEGDKTFDFNTLSDGFSATLDIITSIMMSMEKEDKTLHLYDMHGIVLIDEIDTHLHISLQKSIFKILTDFFPNIQFIVTTHSPFIINSVENAVVYDLEKQESLTNMEVYSYESIAESYFGAKEYNKVITDKINDYECLT